MNEVLWIFLVGVSSFENIFSRMARVIICERPVIKLRFTNHHSKCRAWKSQNFTATNHNEIITFYIYFIYRYKNLNNTVVTRGKVLHAAVHSLQSFDKSLDQVRTFTYIIIIPFICLINTENMRKFSFLKSIFLLLCGWKEKKRNFVRHTFFSFLLRLLIPANQIKVRGKN